MSSTLRPAMFSRGSLLAVAFLVALGCHPDSRPESHAESRGEPGRSTVTAPRSTPESGDAESGVAVAQESGHAGGGGTVPSFDAGYGTWAVVGHSCPHICAMSGEAADAWLGRAMTVSATGLSFGESSCTNVSFVRTASSAADFFRDWRVAPATLGVEQGEIEEVEVLCDGEEWIAPGSLLIVKDQNEMLTVWDGVFFELRRSSP